MSVFSVVGSSPEPFCWVSDELITPFEKGFPPVAVGRTCCALADAGLTVGDFLTPIMTLERPAIEHNILAMQRWVSDRGFELAPHGKTSMSPVIWHQQLAAGAWGITVANVSQLRIAWAVGVRRVVVANEFIDPAALRWARGRLAEGLDLLCWVDSLEAVARMRAGLAGETGPRLRVCVELGAPGGRTGARSVESALEVARAVLEAPELELAGVSGYEGAVARVDGRGTPIGFADSFARVAEYVCDVVALAGYVYDLVAEAAGATGVAEQLVLSLGGSLYTDVVVRELAGVDRSRFVVVLRSGSYVAHDDAHYAKVGPDARGAEIGLRPALRCFARVVSVPERGRALLDAGNRDLPVDEGMPVVVGVYREGSRVVDGGAGLIVERLNDQHAFVAVSGEFAPNVGDVVQLGIAHPCTAFDRWPMLALTVPAEDAAFPRVVGAVSTRF